MHAVCCKDVHKKYSQVAVVNELGEVKEEIRIENTRESLEHLAQKYKGAKAVMEATGTDSSTTS